jgi:hypothetical protein
MAGLHGIALPDVIDSRLPGLAARLASLGIVFLPLPLPALLALYGWIIPLLAIALVPPNTLQVLFDYAPAITMPLPYARDRRIQPLRALFERFAWRPSAGWAVAAAALSACGILALNQVTSFLYWQF